MVPAMLPALLGAWGNNQDAVKSTGPAPTTLSYAELQKAGNRVAARLAILLQPDGCSSASSPPAVALMATNSLETVIALTGLLHAGIPVAPINPAVRSADLEFLLADVSAAALLVRPLRVGAGALHGPAHLALL